jgi:hypothetical protein
LGCRDGSSDMEEVGVDRGGWDDEAVAGRLAGGRAGVCGGQKKGGVDRGPQREACVQRLVHTSQGAMYGRTLISGLALASLP